MSVFQDLAQRTADFLRADADLPPARADVDVALAQNRAADILVNLGASVEQGSAIGYTNWRTDLVINITARAIGHQSAGVMCDLYTARVLGHLRAGNPAYVDSLAGLGVWGINAQDGDRRISRDITQTDTAMGEAQHTLALYHRTVGDSLQPWA